MSRNESFDEILNMLLLEESAPTGEALARWSERYPEHRQGLADFFATWAMPENQTGPEPDTDEDRIVEESVKRAMATLERQGRLAPVEAGQSLRLHDQLVLSAVWLLGGRGYPAAIAEKVGEMEGKTGMLGSVQMSLDRLQAKALVLSRPADPVSEPENPHRRYFTVTMAGTRALAHARETSTEVARFLPDFA
jgi:PadR family transcriptional regulator, regulatory protein PadR